MVPNVRLCRSIFERFKNVAGTIEIALRKHGQLVVVGESGVARTVSYVDAQVFGHAAAVACRRDRDGGRGRRIAPNATRRGAPTAHEQVEVGEEAEADSEVVADGRALLDVVEVLRADPEYARCTLASAVSTRPTAQAFLSTIVVVVMFRPSGPGK